MASTETPLINSSGKHFSSQSIGWLFSRGGLILLAVLLGVAAWYGHTAVAILLALVLTVAVVTKAWSRFSLNGVSCQREFSHDRLFPGENLEMKVRLSNRKLLPLPWIQVEDKVPPGFLSGISTVPDEPQGNYLSWSTTLLWYTTATWKQQFTCQKRGYYPVGPTTVTSGDIFGFYPRSAIFSKVEHIIIYPRIFPIDSLTMLPVSPLGDTRAQRRICEDPTQTIGVRDYSPGDSLRRIHWKASARQQKLQSRVYEPTTTLKTMVFLAVDTFPHYGAQCEENFELGISIAASLANHLIEDDNPVGLFANTHQADSGQPVKLWPAADTPHLISILESLAKLMPQASIPFEEFFQSQRGKLPWGTTLVFIVSHVPSSLPGIVSSLKESGYKVRVIQIGDAGENNNNDGTWSNIRQEADLVGTFYGGQS